MLRRIAFGVGGITVAGFVFGGVVYQRRLKENRSVTAEAFNAQQDQGKVQEALKLMAACGGSKSAAAASRDEQPPFVYLYRYTTCPFCSKVKAALDYHKIPHECIEVEPMFKGEIKHSQYKKVPQMQFFSKTDGPFLVDSDIIVTELAKAKKMDAQLADVDVEKWRTWARASLVRHLVVNLNRSLTAAWGGYSYIDQFDTIPYANKVFLKVMGAPVMYMVSKFMTRPALVTRGELSADDKSHDQDALRGGVRRFVDEALLSPVVVPLATPVEKNSWKTQKPPANGPRPFHGGSIPDLADLDVYGVLQSIRGHAIYDDLIQTTNIGPWLKRMDVATGKAPYPLLANLDAK